MPCLICRRGNRCFTDKPTRPSGGKTLIDHIAFTVDCMSQRDRGREDCFAVAKVDKLDTGILTHLESMRRQPLEGRLVKAFFFVRLRLVARVERFPIDTNESSAIEDMLKARHLSCRQLEGMVMMVSMPRDGSYSK